MNERICNAVIDKITEAHNDLSDEAKRFIINELDEDDIIDYLQAIQYYQHMIKDKYDPDAEGDYSIIEIIKALINCFLEHIDDLHF